MSETLERIESLSCQRVITDQQAIDYLTQYLLSRPVTDMKFCKGYKILNSDFEMGFGVGTRNFEGLNISDLLALIGYEPANSFFRSASFESDRRYSNRKNAAYHCFVLAIILNERSQNDIRIKDFLRISLSAFTDYIFNQVKNVERLSSETAYGSCVADIAAAEEHIGIYMADENEDSSDAFKGNTIGDFISMIIQRGRSQWFPYVISARDFLDKVFAAYDMINIFFMDLIRNTLIPTDRDLFKVQISTGTKSHILEGMHFEECYENPLNLG